MPGDAQTQLFLRNTGKRRPTSTRLYAVYTLTTDTFRGYLEAITASIISCTANTEAIW
jgi:hypothetical protein